MDIFVGNLAARTKAGNLALILAPFSDTFRFTLYEHNGNGGDSAYFGHVTSLSEEEGNRVISLLNGVALHGHKLIVREYIRRDKENRPQTKPVQERRNGRLNMLGMYAMDDDDLLASAYPV